MDIGKQRDSKIHHVIPEHRLGFLGAAKCNCQCRCGRHCPDSCNICRTVVSDNFQRIASRIDPRRNVEHCHPDKMACHNDQHHLDKHGELLCDRSLIGKSTECKADKYRKDRYDNSGHYFQDDLLKFLQKVRHRNSIRPCACQP